MSKQNLMKGLVQLIIICITINVNAQERFLRIELSDKTSSEVINNVHIIHNENTEILSIFAEESKKTYGFQYDKNKNLIATLTSDGLKHKYKEIIGSASEGDKTRLIQKNRKGTKFGSILYDFKNQKTEEIEYEIDMEDQEYLEAYSYGNTSYMFSILKDSNIIRKWSFSISGEVSYEDLNLESELKLHNISGSLYEFMEQKFERKTFVSVTKMDNRLPNSLEIASLKNKMFAKENGFYWTLDKDNQFTVLLDFQLPSLKPSVSIIKKEILPENMGTSNSYIVDNILAQIVSNNEKMDLVFKYLDSQELIKKFTIEKDTQIDFKNSAILQEGSVYSFGSTRKMEKTSKFLRKISSHYNGISLFKTGKGYRATIGGISPRAVGAGQAFLGAFAGAIGGLTISFNPASLSYSTYGLTGSTRIESIFDENFEHLEGEIEENILDKIENLTKNWLKNADEVYLINDKVLFGNYHTSKKAYTMYEFKNN